MMNEKKYSSDEIEKKRQAALQLRQQRTQNSPNPVQSNATKSPSFFQNKNNNTTKSPTNDRNANWNSPQRFKPEKSKSLVMRSQTPVNRFNPIQSKPFYGGTNITANLYMISNSRFAVETSKYCQPLIDTVKTVNSRLYNVETKTWNFHVNDYGAVAKKIADLKNITASGIPRFVLHTFQKFHEPKKNLEIDLSKIDPVLLQVAKPFQLDGIKFGISKKGRCIIADDMGLGKTLQALGIAHYYRENWPLLIVSPSSVRYQWSEAINTFLPSIPSQCVQQIRNTKDYVEGDQITIVSYDLIPRMMDELQKKSFGFIIVDESHFLKNYKTVRTKSVMKLAENANHIILLSGTPALSRPVELYTQITLAFKNFMGWQEYAVRYCDAKKTQFGWNASGFSNMQELQELLKILVMIRRLKKEVLTQLPAKMREIVMLDPKTVEASTEAMKRAKSEYQNNLKKNKEHSILLQYYSETSTAKLAAACNYIGDIIETGEKFLVFAHHKNMIKAVCNLLQKKKVRFIKIDGGLSSEHRSELVDQFQKEDDIMVAVLSITAANAGLNLTAAKLVLFAELFWNPGILSQAEDRVHRIGQDSSVVIRYLIARETADDIIWPLIQNKMSILNKAGLNQDFDMNDIDIKEQKKAFDNQPTLDSFCTQSSTSETKTNTLNADDYKALLEENCEDFEAFDFNV